MDQQIIQMNRNTWRIEDNGVRVFLLTGTEKALLIDSGMQMRNAKDIAETLTSLPVELLNTHVDPDHIGSNGQFGSFYMHPDEESYYRCMGMGGTVIPVRDGDELDLGDRKLKIIHLPGHTAGSIAVLDEAYRVLISGDPVQENGRIYMFGEHRNFGDYIESLEKLEDIKESFDELWPSHANIPVSPDIIGKLIEGAKKVEIGEVNGRAEELHGMKIKVYDLGFDQLLCDPE